MEKLIITDTTVEKAIQQGLLKLNITIDQVDVIVKEEGKKGIFGFGQKNAVIEISKKINIIQKDITLHDNVNKKEQIVQHDLLEKSVVNEDINNINSITDETMYHSVAKTLENIAHAYGANTTVSIVESSKKIIFQLHSDKPGLLIGKYGKIINALQVLAQTLVYKVNEKSPMVIVNVDDYREKRELKLKEIADRSAKRVLKTKQPIFLEPLPAFERKIIHARLSEYDYVTTHSEGKEPYRYLVVEFENK